MNQKIFHMNLNECNCPENQKNFTLERPSKIEKSPRNCEKCGKVHYVKKDVLKGNIYILLCSECKDNSLISNFQTRNKNSP